MNKFLVGAQNNEIAFLRPVPQRLSMEDAVELAAWLASLADPFVQDESKKFKARIKEILEP